MSEDVCLLLPMTVDVYTVDDDTVNNGKWKDRMEETEQCVEGGAWKHMQEVGWVGIRRGRAILLLWLLWLLACVSEGALVRRRRVGR